MSLRHCYVCLKEMLTKCKQVLSSQKFWKLSRKGDSIQLYVLRQSNKMPVRFLFFFFFSNSTDSKASSLLFQDIPEECPFCTSSVISSHRLFTPWQDAQQVLLSTFPVKDHHPSSVPNDANWQDLELSHVLWISPKISLSSTMFFLAYVFLNQTQTIWKTLIWHFFVFFEIDEW